MGTKLYSRHWSSPGTSQNRSGQLPCCIGQNFACVVRIRASLFEGVNSLKVYQFCCILRCFYFLQVSLSFFSPYTSSLLQVWHCVLDASCRCHLWRTYTLLSPVYRQFSPTGPLYLTFVGAFGEFLIFRFWGWEANLGQHSSRSGAACDQCSINTPHQSFAMIPNLMFSIPFLYTIIYQAVILCIGESDSTSTCGSYLNIFSNPWL